MHHANFLPPRYFEFLHHVESATFVLRHIRAHGGCTLSDVADMHEHLCDLRNEMLIASCDALWAVFVWMQSVYDALGHHLDEVAGFVTPQPTA